MTTFTHALLAVILTAIPAALHAQTTDETKAEVPELAAFHEVIYTIWHQAWPAKDVAALKSLLPAVDSGTSAIERAVLPGILRDRKVKWEESLKALRETVGKYKAAAAQSDTQKILDAADKLHSQYEMLVRITRPALKEIESFHQVLYVLYHHELPAYDPEKIRNSSLKLASAMDSLNAARLPERLKGKQKDFEEKRKSLDQAVRQLASAVKANRGEKAVKEAINAVHTRYQALEKVF